MTIVASSRFHNVQRRLIILLAQCIKEPVARVSWGSYQPTAELTCPLPFNATEKPLKDLSLSYCRINLHFKTTLLNICLCESGTARESFTGSLLLRIAHKQGSMSQPNTDLVSLMIRCRPAQTHRSRAMCWWCVTCHGRPRCLQDKAAFGLVSTSLERGSLTKE